MSSSRREDNPLARTALQRYLRTGVRSTQEALTYLRRRGVPASRAASSVAASRAHGLLDDRAAARLWAGHWARQGYAAAAVQRKLAHKGFDEPASRDAIERACPPSEDEIRARLVLAQHVSRASGAAARPRLARALASRGFDSDVIERILGEPVDPSDPDAE